MLIFMYLNRTGQQEKTPFNVSSHRRELIRSSLTLAIIQSSIHTSNIYFHAAQIDRATRKNHHSMFRHTEAEGATILAENKINCIGCELSLILFIARKSISILLHRKSSNPQTCPVSVTAIINLRSTNN